MKLHIIKYISALTLFMGILFSVSSQTLSQADVAYSGGEYAKAVELYNKVLASDGQSSELYYNLGNAYARGGDYGNAMASYLRSLRLDPSNSQTKNNIDYIDAKVADTNRAELKGKKLSLDRDSSSFFTSIRDFIARDHLSDTWAIWAAVSFVLFVICVAIYIFTRQVAARKIGFFGGFIFLGISAITLVFAFMAASYTSHEGVIAAPKVKLLSEASPSSKENPVNLTRGTRMMILDTFPAGADHPKWYKVRLNSDFVGWISANDFIPVNL